MGIRINPSGVVLLFPGQGNDDFYDISSIHFAEAVHFVHTKHKDKKTYFAFVPIDESIAANTGQEKLFTQLDKKFKHLEKVSHPPMLACVMRRPTGVKAVDCHVFIVQHPKDALQMASMIHRFQAGPGHYDRRSFGPPASDPSYRDPYPNPDVIPQSRVSAHEMGPPRDVRPGNREPGEDYAIYRGRGLELRNDHFRANELPSPAEPDGRGFEPNRSFDRNSASYPGFERRSSDERYKNSYDDGRNRPISDRELDNVERRPRELRTNAGFVERDSFGREFQFDNAISHERQRSGDSGPGRARYGSDRAGGMSPRNEYGGRFDRHSDIIPQGRYNQYPNRPDFEPYVGPPVTGNLRDDGPSRRTYHEQSYPRPGGPQSSPHSPRERSPPGVRTPPGSRSPRGKSPTPQDEEVCSASNLESRQEFDANGKPIAKVPPNRHAGVRVLPSLPIPGARSHLKPVSPRVEETSPNQKGGGKAPTYNFEAKDDSDSDNPYDNAPDKRTKDDSRSDRSISEDIALVDRLFEDATTQETSRVKSDGFKYGNSVYTSDQYNRYGGENPPSNQNVKRMSEPYGQNSGNKWSYYDEREKYMKKDRDGWQGDYKSKSAHDFSQPNYGSDFSANGQHVSKDAEIANMFSRMKVGHGAGQGNDFERGLGYLP